MTSDRLTESEISDMLAERIDSLVAEILPNARRSGSELTVGSLAGEPGKSLSIHVGRNARRGIWKDFAGTDGGDALKLVCLVLFGGDYKRAVPWAKSWLGIDQMDPARFEQARQQAQARAAARDAGAEAEQEARRKRAHATWLAARPLERGDPVDRYLLARGIDLGVLEHGPGVLRYHPALPYWVFDKDADRFIKLVELPAMVAAVTELATGRFIACHRTWLRADGRGKAGAAELGHDHRGRVRDAKKVAGSFTGGHIKLWLGRDAAGQRYKGPLRSLRLGRLHISEGIEDGLTAAVADPDIAAIAAITVGNMVTLALPEQARELVMLKQNDAPDSDAAATYLQAVERYRGEGRRVLEAVPPPGVKDLNDLARAGS